jgi:hypothetical protein
VDVKVCLKEVHELVLNKADLHIPDPKQQKAGFAA